MFSVFSVICSLLFVSCTKIRVVFCLCTGRSVHAELYSQSQHVWFLSWDPLQHACYLLWICMFYISSILPVVCSLLFVGCIKISVHVPVDQCMPS